MWSIARPELSAESAFTTCISRVRDPELAGRLANATPTVVAASSVFDLAARRHRLDEVATRAMVAPDLTADEMENIYTQRMAKSGAPGREIYDEILTSAPSGRCPLCMQRLAATLDHHLPKAHYPALVVAPLNLVPVCSDCNKAKKNSVPTAADNVPLHPYYDDLGQEVWLTATVVEHSPSALRFEIVRPLYWDDVLFVRVRQHFRLLKLAQLFTSEAAEELLNIRHQLTLLRDTEIPNGVRSELTRRAASCAEARINSWRAAAYRAWSQSDWFCNGGFL